MGGDSSSSSPLLAVTGASGFLGRALVREAARHGWRVRALVRDRAPVANVEAVPGSITDPYALGRLLDGADAVVHAAAIGVQSRDRSWRTCIETNVIGTEVLVTAAAAACVRTLLLAGSVLEYPLAPGRVRRPRRVLRDRTA